jgi:hypothetical protein
VCELRIATASSSGRVKRDSEEASSGPHLGGTLVRIADIPLGVAVARAQALFAVRESGVKNAATTSRHQWFRRVSLAPVAGPECCLMKPE